MSPETKRNLKFALSAIFLFFILVELGLHGARFLYRLWKPSDVWKGSYIWSSYEGKEWVNGLFKETIEATTRGYNIFFTLWGGSEYRGKYVNIDSLGFRKTWHPTGEPLGKTKTIYVLGASTTWGVGARDDYTIPSHLAKILNKDGYRYEVYNYGTPASTFIQELTHLALLLREDHKPDYVIFYIGFNRILEAYQRGPKAMGGLTNLGEKLEIQSDWDHIWVGLTGIFRRHCMICKTVKRTSAFLQRSKKDLEEVSSEYDEEEAKEVAREIVEYRLRTIELLDNLSKAYGFKYAIFWQPSIFTEERLLKEEEKAGINPSFYEGDLARVFKYAIRRLNQKSVPHFYDLSQALRGRQKPYYIDFVHLNEEGNEIIAEKMGEIFEKEFLK